MAITREAHEQQAAQAAKAARWMHEEMERRQGVLTLDQAWQGVRDNFGSELAPSSATDSWLARSVLSAFRKLTPEVVWDPASKHWRSPRRSDVRPEGARMLNSKAKG